MEAVFAVFGESRSAALGDVEVVGGEILVTQLPRFVRGDANGDGEITVTDPIILLGELFTQRPQALCEAALDFNRDAFIDLQDTILSLAYLLVFVLHC